MVSSKHIVNDPKAIVLDALKGVVALNPNVKLNEEYKVIHLAKVPHQVSIISGGGSGHEPSHAGFVGAGLLSAAVSGNVFASPNTNQVKKALEIVNNDKGTLIVIMQYTGDVLHFGLAKEQFTAQNPSSKIRLLAVGEDVSVGREQGKMVGRRGMAGTVLVYKIAGALAKEGAEIDEVYDLGKYVADRTATLGVGLEHCSLPGSTSTESHLKADEMELGMGIHNEPGLEKITLPKTRDLLNQMITFSISTSDPDRSFVPFKGDGKDEVVLMINNLGGISQLELSGIVGHAIEVASEKGLKVRRVLAGTYMTSLDMPGFSVSLFLLPREGESAYTADQLLSYVDAPGDAPGWAWNAASEPVVHVDTKEASSEEKAVKNNGSPLPPTSSSVFLAAIKQACEDVIAAEPEITRYDTIAGDGDCGTCLKSGGEGVLNALKAGEIDETDVISAVLTLAENIERDMDGTSGALYSIFFNALASGLRKASEAQKTQAATAEVWAAAVSFAKNTLYEYTRARAPSRTLVDPLEVFQTQFSSAPNDFSSAVRQAVDAAAETSKIQAKAGRAAYVGREELSKANVPDPGAHGVGILLKGIEKALSA
ncbi:dihydroxyacetone kinase [Phaffia rhodozyma]|uniref:Dihydroxyacetone kinase n=1 Tax=Phaffia rhodozyma TaxID=264483 RepID=A0A0F7SRQ6_PHARH|nr:dihydroxyacetone kinase [Phaffia rhodozyma]